MAAAAAEARGECAPLPVVWALYCLTLGKLVFRGEFIKEEYTRSRREMQVVHILLLCIQCVLLLLLYMISCQLRVYSMLCMSCCRDSAGTQNPRAD